MAKTVHIHVGAHRTGTSSLQMCLDLNRAALQAAGFDPAYPGRDGVPGGTLRLKLPGPGARTSAIQAMTPAAADSLRQLSPDSARALLLSEENIPGRMFHFYKGLFYPAAEARLQVLKAALTALGCDKVTRVVLVLRAYDSLFTSAYRKRAEDNPVEPFRNIAPRMADIDRGWPALIRAIKNILAPGQFVVIDYARRGSSTDLLRQLVPRLDVPLEEPQETLNASATDAALEALQARYHAGEKLSRADWQAVVTAHADSRDPTGFAAFTEAEIQTLSTRYATHLDKIAGIRGITLIR